jgi:hypothetical protein
MMEMPPLPELPLLHPVPGWNAEAIRAYASQYGESCARMAREEAAKERRDLEEVLATIAAQSSGIPASTSRADCMAALAAAAIRKG